MFLTPIQLLCDYLDMATLQQAESERSAKITASQDRLSVNRAWLTQQREHEIGRLEAILRNPMATDTDLAVAQDQLAYWRQREEY
jgi:hypothetical protein